MPPTTEAVPRATVDDLGAEADDPKIWAPRYESTVLMPIFDST